MKRIPRTVCLLTAAVLLLTGCGADSSPPETAEFTTTETTTAQAETTVTESTSGTTEAEKTTVIEGTTTTAAAVTTTTTASATAAATTSKPPVTTTKRQTTAVQTRATQTTARTTVTQKQTQKSVKVREDWCRLIYMDSHNPVVVKDGKGYYLWNVQSDDPDKEVYTFDASDLVEVCAGSGFICGLAKNGTVRMIYNGNTGYTDLYFEQTFADWNNIVSLNVPYEAVLYGVCSDGTVLAAQMETKFNFQKEQPGIPIMSAWKNVAQMHGTAALCKDGSVLGYGYDDYSEAPYLHLLSGAVQICGNGSTIGTYALMPDGRVMIISFGKLRQYRQDIAYIRSHWVNSYCFLNKDGTVTCYSDCMHNYKIETENWKNVVAADVGAYAAAARQADGKFLLVGAAKAFEPYLN